ncbi:thioesterase II family protein [Streptomyces sp. NPDC001822]|uniref:thioesterase II family protein n=1 Tax=Streptomyces sp. NPDC001822 TaxID=3364614 RepID=UPI0036CF1101
MNGSKTHDDTEVRLFAFHHAGGSSSLYRAWPRFLPPTWDLRALDAPGHGSLMGQPPLDDLEHLVGHFLAAIRPGLDVPYAFFGHSMGAIVAFELTRRLIEEGLEPPVWLGVSSCRAPSEPSGVQRHTAGDEELLRHIAELGGTSEHLLGDPLLWRIFGPLIRTDLRLVETWRSDATDPLDVPLSVFGGRHDEFAPPDRLTPWADRTTTYLGTRLFDGGHFHLSAGSEPLLADVVRDVRTALGPAVSALAGPGEAARTPRKPVRHD